MYVITALGLLLCVSVAYTQDEGGATTPSTQPKPPIPRYKSEGDIKAALFHGEAYDKSIVPQQNSSEPVEVKFGIILQSIDNVNEFRESITTNIWYNMEWSDTRITWNSSSYQNVKAIEMAVSDVWIPDIQPYNHLQYQKPDGTVTFNLNGVGNFIPTLVLETVCPLDFTYYPFDQQICKMKFGSWVHDGFVLNLTSRQSAIDISTYAHTGQWDLLDATSKRNVFKYDCCDEPYIDYTMILRIRRHPGMLLHLYLGPAVCFILMIPVVFLLPPDSNHKLVLGGTLLVSQVVVLNMLADSIPMSHISPPKIAMFYLGNIVLLCLSMACSVLVLSMWSRAKRTGKGVPVVINRIFLGLFGRLLCVRREDFMGTSTDVKDINIDSDQEAIMTEYGRTVAPAEWRQLATVFDRLLLVLFLICTIILAILMFAYKPKY